MSQEVAQTLVIASAQNYNLAISAVAITIMVAGIAAGLGVAFGNRRLRMFGAEEFLQGVVNAAVLGAIAAIISAINSISGEMVLGGTSVFSGCPEFAAQKTSVAFAACANGMIFDALAQTSAQLQSALFALGYISKIVVSVPGLTVQPFFSLEFATSALSGANAAFYFFSAIAAAHQGFLVYISTATFGMALPAGFLLRAFFFTRKLGGALISIAVAFLLVYPLCFASISQQLEAAYQKIGELGQAASQFSSDFGGLLDIQPTDSGFYASVQKTIADRQIAQMASALLSQSMLLSSQLFICLIAIPAIGLALACVFAGGLYRFLGGEMLGGAYDYI